MAKGNLKTNGLMLIEKWMDTNDNEDAYFLGWSLLIINDNYGTTITHDRSSVNPAGIGFKNYAQCQQEWIVSTCWNRNTNLVNHYSEIVHFQTCLMWGAFSSNSASSCEDLDRHCRTIIV